MDGQTFSLRVPSSFKEERREAEELSFLAAFTDESQKAMVVVGATRWTEPHLPDLKEYERQVLPLVEKQLPGAVVGEATEGMLNGFRARDMVLGGSPSGLPIEGKLTVVDGDALLVFFIWAVPKGTAAGVKQAILGGLAQLQINSEGGMNLGAPQELEKRCRGGAAGACTAWGYSQLVEGDVQSGAANLEKGCKGRDGLGCRILGSLHALGEKVPKDDAKAAQMYFFGCSRGDATSCTYLAAAVEEGVGVAPGAKRALRLYEQACKAKEPYACDTLAYKLRMGKGVARAPARALALYQQACDAPLARSCASVADMLMKGEGRSKDDKLARQSFERGCDLGDALSCSSFGLLLSEGTAGEKDPARALLLFERACTAGEPQGCRYLADATLARKDPPADPSEAAELYQQACDMDDGLACVRLSQLYETGNGVTKDTARSAELRAKACGAGLKEACQTQDTPPPGR